MLFIVFNIYITFFLVGGGVNLYEFGDSPCGLVSPVSSIRCVTFEFRFEIPPGVRLVFIAFAEIDAE